jgi:apolipoprotein N-acyltransferase
MKRSVRLLLSISSGIVLSLPWLGFPGWLLFVAFLPLLVLDNYFLSERRQYRSISMWSHAFLYVSDLEWPHHMVDPACHCHWGFPCVLANSLLMSVVVWLAHLIRRNSSGSMGYLSWIVFWLTFEFFHFHWDIEWPWLTLGNGFANNIRGGAVV